MKIVNEAYRYHDFSYGHRVYGSKKCGVLHGHNGRAHFYCRGDLDSVGMVLDFGVLKTKLCDWVEDHWDHKFLVFEQDPWYDKLKAIDPTVLGVHFNPTAENMAGYLLSEIGPFYLAGTGITLVKVVMDETRKCSGIALIG